MRYQGNRGESTIQLLVLIASFHIAFITSISCAYRIVLWKQYERYKQRAVGSGKHHNWMFFAFSHQLNPQFDELYGKVSAGEKNLIVLLSISAIAVFAEYSL